jgi:hypothetical protein
MNARSRALLSVGALVTAACSAGQGPVVRAAAATAEPLDVEPLTNLVPAASVQWLIDVRPTEILATPALASAVDLVLPADRFEAYARGHGGIDLRQAREITIAAFPDATLSLARLTVDPGRIERAFTDLAAEVDGRASENGVTRLWGTVGREHAQVAIFGHDAIGLEVGQLGPLRVAAYYAEGRLKRSLPALRADPLRGPADQLADAPIRAFAPGPFEGSWAKGLGGLLRAATAVAGSLRPVTTPTGAVAMQLTVLILGAWGEDAQAAARRLAATFNVFADDPLGRLAGLNHPLDGPHVVGDATEVRLEVILDPTMLARGVRDATSAEVPDIVASPGSSLTPNPPKW